MTITCKHDGNIKYENILLTPCSNQEDKKYGQLECKADFGLLGVCLSEVTDPGVSASLQLKVPSGLCDAASC